MTFLQQLKTSTALNTQVEGKMMEAQVTDMMTVMQMQMHITNKYIVLVIYL